METERRFASCSRKSAVGAVLCVLFALPLAAQKCVPPADLQAQLKAKPTAELLNQVGDWFGQHEQYDCAAGAFARSLQLEPEQHMRAYTAFMLGASLYYQGELSDATAAFQESERVGNYRRMNLFLLSADALDRQGLRAAAEEQWRKAVEMNYEAPMALTGLARDLLADGKNPAVITLLENPMTKAERTPDETLLLSHAYQAARQTDAAIRVLREGLNTTPDAKPLAEELITLLEKEGHADEAAQTRRVFLSQ